MIEITYIHTRVRTTDYIYDVTLDGKWIAAAVNYSAADRVAQDVEARQQLIAMIEDAVKQAQAEQLIAGDYFVKQQAQAEHLAECPCGAEALYFVQYRDRVYAYCVEHYQEQAQARQPLLAQCAAVIRRCLGRTSGPNGIIDELRRVETQLTQDGW